MDKEGRKQGSGPSHFNVDETKYENAIGLEASGTKPNVPSSPAKKEITKRERERERRSGWKDFQNKEGMTREMTLGSEEQ